MTYFAWKRWPREKYCRGRLQKKHIFIGGESETCIVFHLSLFFILTSKKYSSKWLTTVFRVSNFIQHIFHLFISHVNLLISADCSFTSNYKIWICYDLKMLNSKLASKAYNSIITIRKRIVYKRDRLQIANVERI